MKYSSIILLSAAIVLAGCNKDYGRPDRNITILAGIGTPTRVTTAGNSATFDTGDRIGVYAWTGSSTAVPATLVVDGVENTLGADGNWTPASQMLWDDDSTPHYFIGVYPARKVSDFTADAFTLDPADYEASDLLVAVNIAGLTSADNPVPLTFDHLMARLDVNLTFRDQWGTEPDVTSVTVKAKRTGTVDYLAHAVTAPASETPAAVPLTKEANAAWMGLQVPQDGVREITVTIGGKDFVFTHTDDIPLAKGQFTTVNLNVGKNEIKLGSVSISDWVAGATINDGEAQTDDN